MSICYPYTYTRELIIDTINEVLLRIDYTNAYIDRCFAYFIEYVSTGFVITISSLFMSFTIINVNLSNILILSNNYSIY